MHHALCVSQRLIALLFCLTFLLPDSLLLAQEGSDEELFPFYHGVASGDPLTDRVVVWTRVSPLEASTAGDSLIDVEWVVATDPGLTNVVRSGLFMTGAYRDYTVKVDVDGLQAGTTYYYGFTAFNKASMVGKTKTSPAGMSDHVKFAVVSCNNLQHGYFNAFGRIADRTDLDAVVHLGDYIYEISATGEDFYGAASLRDNGERLHFPDKEILTLEDYRERYAQYRQDPDLRRAHQQHPFILIWDDHESANDAYEDGAENHQPDEGEWTDRKAIAKQVYDEWMPIRSDLTEFPLYRTVSYGDLVDLIMLDTRLEGREEQLADVTNPALYAPERTILGPVQKEWFFDQLSSSQAQWKVIGNQVIFSEFNVWWAANPADPVLNSPVALESIFLDIWDGYPSERDEIIGFIGGATTGVPVDNVVILTGDFHSAFGYDVALRPAPLSGSDPVIAAAETAPVPVQPTYNPETGEGSVAVEFATPSVTSANFDENLPPTTAAGFQFQINKPLPEGSGTLTGINPNPHMKYVDLNRHGYFVLDITPERAQADWFFTEDIFTSNTDESFDDAWYTVDGQNRLQQADGPSAPKAVQDEVAPIAPKPATPELEIEKDEDGNVVLFWIDGTAETEYVIERSNEGQPFEEIGVVEADVTTFLDVDALETSSYRIKAINAAFESEYSNIANAAAVDGARFILIDADADTVIGDLAEGAIIDLRDLASDQLSIQVVFSDISPESVKFNLDDRIERTEFVAPYALGGDEAGDFQSVPELSQAGSYYLNAYAFDSDGSTLGAASLFFQIIDSDLFVNEFALVNAATDADIALLPKGKATIDLATLGISELAIRAEVKGNAESVRFWIDNGAYSRIENEAPYALGGDIGGDYAPTDLLAGSGTFMLYAAPYAEDGARGEEGASLKVAITVEGVQASVERAIEGDLLLIREEIPTQVTLAGNYPNPFNPTTSIQFGLPESMHVRVVLYDMLGRVVDVVTDSELGSGWHDVRVDGSRLASGIYIYQLETDSRVLVGQMILQK